MKLRHIARCAGPPSHFRLVFNERGCCLRRLGSVRPDNASKVGVHGVCIAGSRLPLGTSE